jgi:hypothetical protein
MLIMELSRTFFSLAMTATDFFSLAGRDGPVTNPRFCAGVRYFCNASLAWIGSNASVAS